MFLHIPHIICVECVEQLYFIYIINEVQLVLQDVYLPSQRFNTIEKVSANTFTMYAMSFYI